MDRKSPDSINFAATLGGNLKYLRLNQKSIYASKSSSSSLLV